MKRVSDKKILHKIFLVKFSNKK